MIWFWYTVPPLFILIPLIVAVLVPVNQKARTEPERARRLTLWLGAATAASLALWLVLVRRFDPSAVLHLWTLFFPLFFGLTMPILRAKNPDWVGTPPHDLPVRAASLTPRSTTPPVPRWTVRGMWLLWVAGLAAVVLLAARGAGGLAWTLLRSQSPLGLYAIFGQLFLLIVPAGMGFLLALLRHEPAPADPTGSPELTELFRRRRVLRSWVFVIAGWAMIAIFTAQHVVLAWLGDWHRAPVGAGSTFALVGGILGATVGLLGAGVGIGFSLQAVRLNRRLREAAGTTDSPTAETKT